VTARILVVEDNPDLAAGIEYNLTLEGYDARIADDGRKAIAMVSDWQPDLVLLDLMLPGVDGYHVLQSIRSADLRTPVIILTARAEEADKVRGFRLDADQYVTKPFGILELLERVAALLRRSARDAEENDANTLKFGDVVVDLGSRTITRAGRPVALTPKAFELLLALVRRAGAVARRVDLLKEVWGYGSFIMTRTVDSHIAELRRKLDDPNAPRHIITVWKVGYRFER
jgi:DNA-binding response OmpR family regulator